MEHQTTSQTHALFLRQVKTFHNWLTDRVVLSSKARTLLLLLVVWLLFVLFLALVQFSTPDLPDNDGYYHIKLAFLMRTEGLKPVFSWLPLSILNAREYYDHHFLFHVGLIPFTFGDLRTGAKLAAVFFASLAFLSAWNLLKNQRVPYATLWALGLVAVSEGFIYRMSITRAQSLSLAVLLLGLDFLLRGKNKSLTALAFVYVWLYDAFPLMFVIAAVYVLSRWVTEHTFNLKPLGFAAVGTLLGMLINPYFPHNLVFSVQHILPKLFETTSVSVGNEWYPYTTAQLMQNSPLALAALVSGFLALGLSGRKIDQRTLTTFGITLLFGVMLMQSRRFFEYFPPFALVFAAFAWTPIMETMTRNARQWVVRPVSRLVLLALLVSGAWLTLQASQASMRTSKPYQTYADASAWLTANSPAGSMVFQTDWDDFPRLFFYNTHNTYLIGLDPTYMAIYNPDLYSHWVDVTRGKVEQIAETARTDFGASYIFTDLHHESFLSRADVDPGLEEVFRDEYAVVFKVK
jgi:hypothetical protein